MIVEQSGQAREFSETYMLDSTERHKFRGQSIDPRRHSWMVAKQTNRVGQVRVRWCTNKQVILVMILSATVHFLLHEGPTAWQEPSSWKSITRFAAFILSFAECSLTERALYLYLFSKLGCEMNMHLVKMRKLRPSFEESRSLRFEKSQTSAAAANLS